MNPVLYIDQEQIYKNFQTLKKQTSSEFMCPMVKANAYGVGDSIVVKQLLNFGVSRFGVVSVHEGLKLRRFFSGDEFEVLIFSPVLKEHIPSYIADSLTMVVGSFDDLKCLNRLSLKERLLLKPIHLEFDLGMSRLGFTFKDLDKVKEILLKLGVKVSGVCGHFYESEQSLVEAQLVSIGEKFDLNLNQIHGPSTSVIEKGMSDIGIRPGLGLYVPSSLDSELGLKGALKLEASVVHRRRIKKGQGVSYGHSWVSERETDIAILLIGYADGLKRGLSNKISFKSGANLYPQVGAICMDYTMVDLGLDSHVKVGDSMVLFDQDLRAFFEWTEILKTIPYEILTGLGERVERRLI